MSDELPHGWARTTLGSLGSWLGGGTPSKSVREYWENGTIHWVSPKDMKRLLIDSAQDQITIKAVKESSANLVPENSVLMVTRSGILEHSFPVAVNTVSVAVNQDLKAVTPFAGIDPTYMAYFLKARAQNILGSCSKDGTTVSSIDTDALTAFKVELAPTAEQQRIVSKIDELFSRIDDGERALERVQKLVERYRQSVLKAAVTGELTRDWREKQAKSGASVETGEALLARILTARREAWEQAELDKMKAKGVKPKDDKWKERYEPATTVDTTDLLELPEGWVWASLDQTCRLHAGLGFPKHLQGKTEGKYPFYKVSDVSRCYLSGRTKLAEAPHNIDEDVLIALRGKTVPAGAVVFARIGEGLKLERRVMTSVESLVDNNVIGVKSAGMLQDEYLYLALKTVRMGDLAQATTVPAVRSTDIAAVPIAVAPAAEQQQILDRSQYLLQQADWILSEVISRTRAISNLRSGILKSAFSGSLVAQDLADEPASDLLVRISAEHPPAPVKPKRGAKSKKKASK